MNSPPNCILVKMLHYNYSHGNKKLIKLKSKQKSHKLLLILFICGILYIYVYIFPSLPLNPMMKISGDDPITTSLNFMDFANIVGTGHQILTIANHPSWISMAF